MRATAVLLAVLGGGALALAVALHGADGQYGAAGWVLVGPLPFYAAGLLGYLRRPGRPTMLMLGIGVGFAVGVFLDGALLPVLLTGWPAQVVWAVAMLERWVSLFTVIAAVGLVGLFPTGRVEREYERWLTRALIVVAFLLPLLGALANPELPKGSLSDPYRSVSSPFFWPALADLGTVTEAAYSSAPLWPILGVFLLTVRYRRATADQRRRIRWLLFGTVVGLFVVWAPLLLLEWLSVSESVATTVTFIVWPVGVVVILGSFLVALLYDGVFGIDRPARRTLVYRVLWVLITLGYVTAAAALGIFAARAFPIGVAVLIAIAATLLFQPARRRLERLAGRWVFGRRLDGYELLSRFGAVLDQSPGPTELLPALATAVRDGLGATWVRVLVDPPAADSTAMATGVVGIDPDQPADPALVTALVHGTTELGRIECGPRHEGAFVDEDRRLLADLARQAAAAVHNLYLTAALSARLDVIRRQTRELAASRERVAQGQDAERRRIQRDLHDGVQQDVVVLTAKLGLVHQRLQRGDPRAEELLAELHHDLGTLLGNLREFAYAIHPPVLSDQGLLEAIEAQAVRVPLAMVVKADPALRGMRYPPHIETTAWYAISEALTNAVKHAHATMVEVSLRQLDHRLMVEVRDDGCGFSPGARGLGLASLADRMDIVGGSLNVNSAAGAGTVVRVEIPVTIPEVAGA